MDLHIVSGFLGSGKTTAIMTACKLLMAKGTRVGVVTNDQGRYLVDTAFFRLGHVPAVEVSGGCFCCNYGDLSERLSRLQDSAQPDVIFAESVGSCADIVATVVEPLLELRGSVDGATTLSAFADARLLRRRLLDLPMPYSDDVLYIFDMQLQEAERIVVNKVDLLPEDHLIVLNDLVVKAWPGKTVLWQNSLDEQSVSQWVASLWMTDRTPTPVEIDYDRYDRGETQLAWLDQTLMITAPEGRLRESVVTLLEAIVSGLRKAGAGIAHLKFMLSAADSEAKVSVTAADDADWHDVIPAFAGGALAVIVNARVEAEPALVDAVVQEAVSLCDGMPGVDVEVEASDAFRPSAPSASG